MKRSPRATILTEQYFSRVLSINYLRLAGATRLHIGSAHSAACSRVNCTTSVFWKRNAAEQYAR